MIGALIRSTAKKDHSPDGRRFVVMYLLRLFSWLTLLSTLLVFLGVAWQFGTVAVATSDGIHRQINPVGAAGAIGILFVGTLITLFLLVVCASAKTLVELREQRRDESQDLPSPPLGKLAEIPYDEMTGIRRAGTDPQIAENLPAEQEARLDSARGAGQLERQLLHLEQENRRLHEEFKQERQRSTQTLATVQEGRRETQKWNKQLEEKQAGLTDDLQTQIGLAEQDEVVEREANRSSWRKLISVAALLVGFLAMWLVSLLVALSLLYP